MVAERRPPDVLWALTHVWCYRAGGTDRLTSAAPCWSRSFWTRRTWWSSPPALRPTRSAFRVRRLQKPKHPQLSETENELFILFFILFSRHDPNKQTLLNKEAGLQTTSLRLLWRRQESQVRVRDPEGRLTLVFALYFVPLPVLPARTVFI